MSVILCADFSVLIMWLIGHIAPITVAESKDALLEALGSSGEALSRDTSVGVANAELLVEGLQICAVGDDADEGGDLLTWAVAHAVFAKNPTPKTRSLLVFIQ